MSCVWHIDNLQAFYTLPDNLNQGNFLLLDSDPQIPAYDVEDDKLEPYYVPPCLGPEWEQYGIWYAQAYNLPELCPKVVAIQDKGGAYERVVPDIVAQEFEQTFAQTNQFFDFANRFKSDSFRCLCSGQDIKYLDINKAWFKTIANDS